MIREDATVEIRSFRVCFQFERRLYKIDRWRMPAPYGVPVRGIVYAIATLSAILLSGRIPVFATVLGLLPISVRYFGLPLATAYVLTRVKLDGRSAHTAVMAWARHLAAPRRVCAFHPADASKLVLLENIAAVGNVSDGRVRRAVVSGPATVILRCPATFEPRGRTLRVRRLPGSDAYRGKQVNLGAGQTMLIV